MANPDDKAKADAAAERAKVKRINELKDAFVETRAAYVELASDIIGKPFDIRERDSLEKARKDPKKAELFAKLDKIDDDFRKAAKDLKKELGQIDYALWASGPEKPMGEGEALGQMRYMDKVFKNRNKSPADEQKYIDLLELLKSIEEQKRANNRPTGPDVTMSDEGKIPDSVRKQVKDALAATTEPPRTEAPKAEPIGAKRGGAVLG